SGGGGTSGASAPPSGAGLLAVTPWTIEDARGSSSAAAGASAARAGAAAAPEDTAADVAPFDRAPEDPHDEVARIAEELRVVLLEDVVADELQGPAAGEHADAEGRLQQRHGQRQHDHRDAEEVRDPCAQLPVRLLVVNHQLGPT